MVCHSKFDATVLPPQLLPGKWSDIVNRQVLLTLAANPDMVRALEAKYPSSNRTNKRYTDGVTAMNSTLSIMRDGDERSISYFFGHKQKTGRLYARQEGCLQRMQRVLRHALCHGKLRDFDMANAYPAIAYDLVCNLGGGDRFPLLKGYVQNREETLQQLSVQLGTTRDSVKELLRAVLHGMGEQRGSGAVRWNNFVRNFATECKGVAALISRSFPDVAKKFRGHQNSNVKAMCEVLGIYESAILRVMCERAAELGVEVRVPFLDGFMCLPDVPDNFAEELTAAVHAKLPFPSVRIIEKPIPYINLEAEAAELGIELAMPHLEPVQEVTASPYLPENLLVEMEMRVILLKAAMGTGKTHVLMRMVRDRLRKKWSVLVVTQRKSMVRTYCERACALKGVPKPARYDVQEKHGGTGDGAITPEKFPHAVVEYESIKRVKGKYDLIIMDEFCSLVTTMNSRTNGANGIEREVNLSRINYLMTSSKQCVAMDADVDVTGSSEGVLRKVAADILRDDVEKTLSSSREAGIGDEERVRRLEAAAALNDKLQAGDVSDVLTKYVWPHTRISRNMRCTNTDAGRVRLYDMVASGKRVGICVQSKEEALILRDIIATKIGGDDKVGVYYGGCKALDDLCNLNEEWDKFKVIIFTSCITTGADYSGDIDAVFVFPCVGVSTPRDVHQMIGRFRNVTSKDVFFCANLEWVEKMKLVTHETVDADYESELLSLKYGHTVVKEFTKKVKDMLVSGNCVPGPRDIMHDAWESCTLMQSVIAYDRAERRYCETGAKFVSFFKYMCDIKGYTWSTEEGETDPAAVKQAKKERKAAQEAHKDKRAESVAGINVQAILQNGDQEAINALARGRRVKNQAAVLARLATVGVNHDNMKDAAVKVKLTRELRDGVDHAELTPDMLDESQKYADAIIIQRAFSATRDPAILLHDAYLKCTEAGSNTVAVPIAQRISLGDELMRNLGLRGIGDMESPINLARAADAKDTLRKMSAIGLCRFRDDDCAKAAQRVLENQLGFRVTDGSPVELRPRIVRLLDMYRTFDAREWYANVHDDDGGLSNYEPDETADDSRPKVNKYAPRDDMSIEALERMKERIVGRDDERRCTAEESEANEERWQARVDAIDAQIARKRMLEASEARDAESRSNKRVRVEA